MVCFKDLKDWLKGFFNGLNSVILIIVAPPRVDSFENLWSNREDVKGKYTVWYGQLSLTIPDVVLMTEL